MSIQFWINRPTILFDKNYILELWPLPSMCYERKINAITRLIILLTFIGYLITYSKKIIVIGIITLLIIYILFSLRNKKLTKKIMENFSLENPFLEKNEKNIRDDGMGETFDSTDNNDENVVPLDALLNSDFKNGNKKNPFSNVLLTEINDDPERKSAPPSFNVDVDEDITRNVKNMVQTLNPDIKNTNKQLFGDLWQLFQLDQSNRVFYSMPSTRVTNDQGAYSQFLYNNLKYSGKESTPEGAFARVQDNYRYILY